MLLFRGGPADGGKLLAKRAPYFLRLVHNAAGEWDCLDQTTDTVDSEETVYCYFRASKLGKLHIRLGKGKAAYFASAIYCYYDRQPPTDTMRSNDKWKAWAMAEFNQRAEVYCDGEGI